MYINTSLLKHCLFISILFLPLTKEQKNYLAVIIGPSHITAFFVCSFVNLSHTLLVWLCLHVSYASSFVGLLNYSLALQRHTGQIM